MLATADTRPGDRSAPARTTRKPLAGRPPLPPEEKASARLQIRITQQLKDTLEKAARAENKTLTEWLLEKGEQAARSSLKRRQKK
ncbi:MAG: DUF1778 domain-containing protein [Planctomycetota bacterium]